MGHVKFFTATSQTERIDKRLKPWKFNYLNNHSTHGNPSCLPMVLHNDMIEKTPQRSYTWLSTHQRQLPNFLAFLIASYLDYSNVLKCPLNATCQFLAAV